MPQANGARRTERRTCPSGQKMRGAITEIHVSTPMVVGGGVAFGGRGHYVEGASHRADLAPPELAWPTSAQPLVSQQKPPLGELSPLLNQSCLKMWRTGFCNEAFPSFFQLEAYVGFLPPAI